MAIFSGGGIGTKSGGGSNGEEEEFIRGCDVEETVVVDV
jgi:hypothetical protein